MKEIKYSQPLSSWLEVWLKVLVVVIWIQRVETVATKY